ncbi:hypothetical protein CONPUDRAFT_159502 [Coniophora puteana RWD-64-598 SS2]|uniref:Uncharacterized protein n=1 Tax=Coniophora puteana (strain RWD-64-598) TaxID=741705 RepID=A0A5M3M9P7_CONPW|nr:uncharacterized protein CONPUDRAFT_159502 [Coniophora puteana RWD-64-598 SS2]EIW75381.1 hypothetical protein CONPUDRAFT_159502 [Coniophora puteana RWD-64-598 SS2]
MPSPSSETPSTPTLSAPLDEGGWPELYLTCSELSSSSSKGELYQFFEGHANTGNI